MEELWYNREKESNERLKYLASQDERLAQLSKTKVTSKLSDFTKDFSVTGPWMFVSNIKNLKIVYQASSRSFDAVTHISTYNRGTAIQFQMGRFVTDDPRVVDFLLSKSTFGSKFVAAFNVEEYKNSRRATLGMDLKETEPEVEEEYMPETIELSEEELAELDTPQGMLIEEDPERPYHMVPKSLSTPETLRKALEEPYVPAPEDRVTKLEGKLAKLESMLEVLVERTLDKNETPEPMASTEKKGYTCNRCGMDGFTSGAEVARHRRTGECNRVLAERLAQGAVRDVHTGMVRAR